MDSCSRLFTGYFWLYISVDAAVCSLSWQCFSTTPGPFYYVLTQNKDSTPEPQQRPREEESNGQQRCRFVFTLLLIQAGNKMPRRLSIPLAMVAVQV